MELGAPKIFEPFNNMDEAAKADAANLTPQEAADIYKNPAENCKNRRFEP
jgi:hypothetical protein